MSPRSGAFFAIVAGLIVASAPTIAAGPAPTRIVSINLCADQLAMTLLPREYVLSLSFLARDSSLSSIAAMAQDLPINRGGADEVLALKPDLVLAGAFGARPTLALLRRLGVPVHEVAIANDLAGICTEINRLALRLGVATRGAELVAELQRRIATPARASGRSAAFYYPNGLSAGANTLPDSLLRMAGLRNAAAEGGLSGYGTLGLENVLTLDPDYLLVVGSEDGAPSRAAALLSHPAIAASFAPSRRVNVAHHYLECGGPIIVELIDRLAAATSSP